MGRDQFPDIEDIFSSDHPSPVFEFRHSTAVWTISFWNARGERCFLSERVHSTPHGCRPQTGDVAGGHQQLRLIRLQRFGGGVGFRPPYESSFGQALLRQPVSLAIIGEEADRGPAAAPKHEHTSGEGVFGELLLAQPRQRINALAAVHGFNRHQHAHLRGDLDHPWISCQARSTLAQSGGTAAFHWTRILPPPADSNSITHSGKLAVPLPISSTNAGLLSFRDWLGIPSSRCFNRV